MKQFNSGEILTVRALKDIIKDWPETDKYGDDCEVWMTTGFCASSPVINACPLNYRKHEGKEWADILFSPAEGLFKGD